MRPVPSTTPSGRRWRPGTGPWPCAMATWPAIPLSTRRSWGWRAPMPTRPPRWRGWCSPARRSSCWALRPRSCPRTMELGRYFGIYRDGRLAAMIGERLGTGADIEMSAICTHPDFNGLGYARRLTAWLTNQTLEQGRLPFLHVSPGNTRAWQLYEGMGFRLRRHIPFWSLQAPVL